jgi:putative membrane protein
MRPVLVVLALGAVLLAGCGRREAPPPAPRPPREAPRQPEAREAVSAAEYVETASSIDLFAIRASELALTRSSNARVREAARELVAGHRGTSGQLSLAGRRLNLLPDAIMSPLHRRMMDELVLAVNFDRAWLERLIAVHRAAVELHGDYAARGASPTLRPVAAAALPIERRHLQQLRNIR